MFPAGDYEINNQDVKEIRLNQKVGETTLLFSQNRITNTCMCLVFSVMLGWGVPLKYI